MTSQPASAAKPAVVVPRRLIVTLQAYVTEGSHKAGAHRLGISETTSRQRLSQLYRLLGTRTAAEAVWVLREELGRVTQSKAAQD